MVTGLTLAAAMTGALYVGFAMTENQRIAGLFRFITVGVIVAMAFAHVGSWTGDRYGWAICFGLLFGWLGDLFFVLPRERFMAGLVAYLVGHLGYIYAFSYMSGLGGLTTLLPLLVILPVTRWIFRRVARGMQEHEQGALVIPAAVYVAVLVVMLWRGWVVTLTASEMSLGAVLPAVGASLFFFADAVLVWHRFIKKVPLQPLVEMGSYFVAQYCIALTVLLHA